MPFSPMSHASYAAPLQLPPGLQCQPLHRELRLYQGQGNRQDQLRTDCCAHSSVILVNSPGNAFELTNATLSGLEEPVIQIMGAVFGQHLQLASMKGITAYCAS